MSKGRNLPVPPFPPVLRPSLSLVGARQLGFVE